MLESNVTEMSQSFESIVETLMLSLKAAQKGESEQMLQVVEALRQNFQIMLRLDSDVKNKKSAGLDQEEISEIADHALTLLDEVAASFAGRGMQDQMMALHQLSLPVVNWLKLHGGYLKKLDIVVNSIASLANTLQDTKKLEQLCALINNVVDVVDQSVRADLEANNPMRPWRVLNLNWGIVATRTHNTELMEHVFDQLIANIPADAQQFFKEGLQQMDIVNYPEHVRIVMQKYAGGAGGNSVVH